MIKSAKGQTPFEISQEFIAAMKQMPSGGPDAEEMINKILEYEQAKVVPPAIYDRVKHVRGTNYDATTIPLIVRNKVNISILLLDFIAAQSSTIPDFINTMVGLYAATFYEDHPRSDQLTLNWVADQIGNGKIIYFRQFFPWASVCRDANGINMFNIIEDTDLYLV